MKKMGKKHFFFIYCKKAYFRGKKGISFTTKPLSLIISYLLLDISSWFFVPSW